MELETGTYMFMALDKRGEDWCFSWFFYASILAAKNLSYFEEPVPVAPP